MNISEEQYKQAKEIIDLYEKQLRKKEYNKFLPILEPGLVLEYKDLSGRWYPYTKELQDNIHFYPPLGLRVLIKSNKSE